jgi:cytochrome c peroxidase
MMSGSRMTKADRAGTLRWAFGTGGLTFLVSTLLIASTIAGPSLAASPVPATTASCTGYTTCPTIYLNRNTFPDAQKADAVIAMEESAAVAAIRKAGVSPTDLRLLLGKALLFDTSLSVNGNVACDTCHSRLSGFTGPISAYNAGSVAYNGSSGVRSGPRRPITYGYAPYSPVLHFDPTINGGTFVGGAFSDMRATGLVTGNPAADQALGPFLSPEEYGMPDPACVVFRMSQAPYRPQFEKVWGLNSFKITFPSTTAAQCSVPNSSDDPNPEVLQLSDADRAQATTTFQDAGLSIANFELSSEVSPFTSKFDAVQAGTDSFTSQEAQGFQLFNGKALCSHCHVSAGNPPLFTGFAAVNIGIPKNSSMPFNVESVPDSFGYIANPQGPTVIDNGVGAFLARSGNPVWKSLAPKFVGTFQVPTLRNTARIARAGFTKAHGHNGFFKSLQQVVHFYNTRDVLGPCGGANTTIGVNCWPPPEVTQNLDTRIGHLGLSATEEAAIVAFLGTLTDTVFNGP